jgi:hypothetical protein
VSRNRRTGRPWDAAVDEHMGTPWSLKAGRVNRARCLEARTRSATLYGAAYAKAVLLTEQSSARNLPQP